MKMKGIFTFLLISVVVLIDAQDVKINPSIVDTLYEANNMAKAFVLPPTNPIGRVNHQSNLIDVVNQDEEDSVQDTLVDIMVKSTPQTARADNIWLKTVLQNNGNCKIKWSQWELLEQQTMKGVDSFYLACIECIDDSDWADIVPSIYEKTVTANLGKAVKKDIAMGNLGGVQVELPSEVTTGNTYYDSGRPVDPPSSSGGEAVGTGSALPPPTQKSTGRTRKVTAPVENVPISRTTSPVIMDGYHHPLATTGAVQPPTESEDPAYDEVCGDPNNYIWSHDALDGSIDCKLINDPNWPDCKYIRDEGASGTLILIDTGIDREHPDLIDKWNDGTISTPCYLSSELQDEEFDNCWNDVSNHGTTMAAQSVGKVTGIAQQAQLISAKVFYNGTMVEAAFIDAVMDLTKKYSGGLIQRPALAYTGATLIFSKWTCEWDATDQNAALCGIAAINAIQFMILNGLILVMPASNGWYNMRDYNPAKPMGMDICSWAEMTATEELQHIDQWLYYPAYTLHGDETGIKAANKIRPLRVTNYDQTFKVNPYFKISTRTITECEASGFCIEHEEQDLEFNGANWGNAEWCLDWAVPAQRLNKIATLGMLQGNYNPDEGHYNIWNDTMYYDPESYACTGVTFPRGYRSGQFKKAATSFGVPIAAGALLSYMIEYNDVLERVQPFEMTETVSDIVENFLDKDNNGNTIYYSTIDQDNIDSYTKLREFIVATTEGFELQDTYDYMSSDIDIPRVKHLKMTAIDGFTLCNSRSNPVDGAEVFEPQVLAPSKKA